LLLIYVCLRLVLSLSLSLSLSFDGRREKTGAMPRFELKVSKKNGKLMLGIYVLQSCLLDVHIGNRIANNWDFNVREREREK
jgi:hypothetical protein